MEVLEVLNLVKEPVRTPLVAFSVLVLLLLLLERKSSSPYLEFVKLFIAFILFMLGFPLFILLFKTILIAVSQ